MGSLIELIIIDDTSGNHVFLVYENYSSYFTLDPGLLSHPFHLHGTGFRIIGQGQGGIDGPIASNIETRIINNVAIPLKPHGHFGITKDTVMVPSGGYVVLRFWATNPGK